MQRTANDLIALLQPHYDSALQYCRALYNHPKDAEDGLQDAILRAMQHFKALRKDEKFRSWFFTIITHTFYQSRRRGAVVEKLFVPLQESHQALCEVYNDDELYQREKIMLKALETLTDKERTAILLFEIGGLSLEEIRKAQKELSISAVKSRLSRTRLKLRSIIIELEKRKIEKGGSYASKIPITRK